MRWLDICLHRSAHSAVDKTNPQLYRVTAVENTARVLIVRSECRFFYFDLTCAGIWHLRH